MNRMQIIRRTALILGIVLVVGIFVRCVVRWNEVAAVQDSLQGDWQINYNTPFRPQYLPVFADKLAERILRKMYKDDLGNRNRETVYRDRFQCLFRGSLRRLDIFNAEDLHDNFGPAISHLRQLEALVIREDDGARLTKEHWQAAFRAIAHHPILRELDVGGERITSETLSALAGALKLEKLTIVYARLNPEFLATLPPLPTLKELHIGGIIRDEAMLSVAQGSAKGVVLPQYEHLEKLTFLGNWTNEDEWKAFLRSLAQYPNLQELMLSDFTLTNEALTTLASARKLRKLSIYGKLNTGCADTLRMLPALRELTIASTLEARASTPEVFGFSEASLATIRAALPNVRGNEP